DSMRAGFYNITLGATRAHLVRSVLESIAYSVKSIVEQMQKDTKVKITDVRVDGGMTANDFFVQYQSDLLNQQILVAKEPESTSLGAAFVCGLTFGAFENFDDLRKMYKIGKAYKPSKNKDDAIKNYEEWLKLLKNTIKSEK
ncbi:MAG: glycerol kinase, partial [Clostridia bacterium]|nr:glycerol kinase [Clostridia bacterium]